MELATERLLDRAPPHSPDGQAKFLERSQRALWRGSCNSLCDGYEFFGVQNGGTGCFCGATYGRYGPSAACNMSCAGNLSEICGGAGVNSIYRVANTSTTW